MKISAVTISAAIFASVLFAASAQAQNVEGMGGMGGGFGGRHHRQAKAKKETPKPKVDEKAYSAALKELPDKQFDAWHGVR
jgi:hypothetical protein